MNERFLHSTGKNICGGAWKDRSKVLTKSFNHKSDTLNIKVYSTLNEAATNESFGFNDIVITTCN